MIIPERTKKAVFGIIKMFLHSDEGQQIIKNIFDDDDSGETATLPDYETTEGRKKRGRAPKKAKE